MFNALIDQEQGNTEYHLYRGRLLTRLGKGTEALVDFDLLIGFEPYNTDFISDRSVVLHLLGRNEEALQELDRAANLDPNNPYRYSSRAYFKDRVGDFVGAIEDYEKAIALDPEDAIAYNNLGIVEERLGRKEKAQRNFNKADELAGYPPKKEDNNLPEIGSTSPKMPLNPTSRPQTSSTPNKISLSHFFSTLTALFTAAATRKEFTGYLKTILGGKTPKNS